MEGVLIRGAPASVREGRVNDPLLSILITQYSSLITQHTTLPPQYSTFNTQRSTLNTRYVRVTDQLGGQLTTGEIANCPRRVDRSFSSQKLTVLHES